MNGGRDAADHGLQTSGEPVDPRAEREVSARPGDGSLGRIDAVKDEAFRRWDVTTPSATLIGRPENPDEDVGENLRRLHDEQHPAMAGHSERMHRLEKARITHAFCNTLGLTPWERDRALGIMTELDLTVFGSQRAIQKVGLVVIQHVVDDERQRILGLHDREWVAAQPPESLADLHERFDSIKDDPIYRTLLDLVGLDVTSVNRLHRTLQTQLDEQDLRGAVFGREPHRDPSLPAFQERDPTEVPGPSADDAAE
ncbi:DNA-directed RNA polymerase subunit epsilon [Halosimplex aquaticum]|uniref:DNA-directed RNA polymerase subunit epsilon n=1 Tax=Halosimplex aquaticum TaxID=3026162 RepID=A0ABD5Y1F0_9EURY|nr:DNA-directed RNA polymerase subunit epsilon [Halosimplex aquaticum]